MTSKLQLRQYHQDAVAAVMDKLARRRKQDLATFKRIRYARRLGHPAPERLTFADASVWLNDHARARAA